MSFFWAFKVKNGIRVLLKKDRIICVDYLCYQDGKLAMCGWVVNKTRPAIANIDLYNESSKLDVDLYAFERMDVFQKYRLSQPDYCFGFFLSVNVESEKLSKLKLVWEGRKFTLVNMRYEEVASVAKVLSQVPASVEIKNSGLPTLLQQSKGNAVSSFTQNSKNKDKDIQKITDILNQVNSDSPNFVNQLEKNTIPLIHKIWKKRIANYSGARVIKFGDINAVARVSIIVPLYGRYDFMQHQIAHFSGDKDMSGVELVYVLDDPSLIQEVTVSAGGLFKTFKYPFKLVLSENNRGFSGANNLGVEYCSSPLVLFLNSDVIPFSSGWLSELIDQYECIKVPTILGATLLYEDQTIQHMGMHFQPEDRHSEIRMNHHPFKGLHFDLVDKDDMFSVQAVTGACMLMARALFEQVGGFDEMHILGDFEDSDLCLKVVDLGGEIFCSSIVKLYHLERLSQNLVAKGDWKWKLSMTNGAYQESKWRSLIDKVVIR